MTIKKKNSDVLTLVENVLGCKWTVRVFEELGKGRKRPGEIQRSITGISEKVLSERFRKLQHYQLITKKVFPVVPPHVEYKLTKRGKKLFQVLELIRKLD